MGGESDAGLRPTWENAGKRPTLNNNNIIDDGPCPTSSTITPGFDPVTIPERLRWRGGHCPYSRNQSTDRQRAACKNTTARLQEGAPSPRAPRITLDTPSTRQDRSPQPAGRPGPEAMSPDSSSSSQALHSPCATQALQTWLSSGEGASDKADDKHGMYLVNC